MPPTIAVYSLIKQTWNQPTVLDPQCLWYRAYGEKYHNSPLRKIQGITSILWYSSCKHREHLKPALMSTQRAAVDISQSGSAACNWQFMNPKTLKRTTFTRRRNTAWYWSPIWSWPGNLHRNGFLFCGGRSDVTHRTAAGCIWLVRVKLRHPHPPVPKAHSPRWVARNPIHDTHLCLG